MSVFQREVEFYREKAKKFEKVNNHLYTEAMWMILIKCLSFYESKIRTNKVLLKTEF